MEAGLALSRFALDRGRYIVRQIRGENPHATVIRAFAAYVRDEGPPPTPIDEVDYVVRNCDVIGREIDSRLAEYNLA
jgi:hypothetical protein